MTHHKKSNRVVRWIAYSLCLAVVLAMLSVLVVPHTSAQNVSAGSDVSLGECVPVGESTLSATVHVCGVSLDGSTVSFDVYAQESGRLYAGVTDLSKQEDNGAMHERSLAEGSNTVEVPAPRARTVGWTVGNLEGFARGQVGQSLASYVPPTWFEFFAGIASAVSAVISNVVVAVLIVLAGRREYIRRLW